MSRQKRMGGGCVQIKDSFDGEDRRLRVLSFIFLSEVGDRAICEEKGFGDKEGEGEEGEEEREEEGEEGEGQDGESLEQLL